MDDEKNESRIDPDQSGTVSIDDAAVLYAQAGVPRTTRRIRYYCQSGVLACTKAESSNNHMQYLIDRASLDRHISELQQIFRPRTGSSRIEPDASGSNRLEPVRPNAVSIEREMIDILKEQVNKKDEQISELTAVNRQLIERDRETNILLKLMQEQLLSLNSGSEPDASGSARIIEHNKPNSEPVSEQGITS